MLAEIRFRPITPEDVRIVTEHIRSENVAELEVIDGFDLPTVMDLCINQSAMALTGEFDGEPVCLFGVVATSPGVGAPWMFGSSLIDKHAVAFLRGSKTVISVMLNEWDYLENWADTRNLRGLRWIRFMGFTIHPAQPYGLKGMLFHRFEKGVRPCVLA
jgi:hypothetical protein